ncbi:unnamed protein product [Didymodactylos carnosus]|uniref:BED-type domain-containing protein n=1 Tax=Didymodactylos carnosus TaxID=1234261 RepID=A0A815D159_9BILA|nr:unnamed protein product [Didymodactylos carnosus]CAF4106639.1 unnamed protein product [Didymodactylos carnosus]
MISTASSSFVLSTTTSQTQSISLANHKTRVIKRKSRSLVWNYFSKLTDDNALCTLCQATITRTGTTTSSFIYHLSSKHPEEHNLMKKKLRLTKKSEFTSLPLDNERSQYLTRLAAEFLIYNLLPMSLVDCPKLQTIFTEIEPSYGLPCRKYMMKTVLEKMYNDTRTQVANELKNTNGVCLTMDGWSSQTGQAYLTVTAHFITKDYVLKSVVLVTIEFEGNHTSERCNAFLEELCIEWLIFHLITCLVSDNCSAMKKTGVMFGRGWFGCGDHLINLCVQDALKLCEVSEALTSIRKVVSHVKNSHLAREHFHQQQFHLKEKSFQKHLNQAKLSTGISWDLLTQIKCILKPFETATRELSSEAQPTMSRVLSVVTALFNSLEPDPKDSSLQQKVKNTIRSGMERRFENVYKEELVLLCTVLDPNFKNFLFATLTFYDKRPTTKALIDKMGAFTSKQEAYNLLKQQYDLVNPYNTQSTVTTQPCRITSDSNDHKETDLFDFMVDGGHSNQAQSQSRAMNEFEIYSKEEQIPKSLSSLEWWKSKQTKYPVLSELARKYLSIQSSSAPSERIFSTAGLITSDRRSRLTPDNADTIIFLNKNMNW